MSDSFNPESVNETSYPKNLRVQFNKVVKLFKRPWTVAFNNDAKNEFKFSGEKVVLNLGVLLVDMCKNGRPRQAKMVGTLLPPPIE